MTGNHAASENHRAFEDVLDAHAGFRATCRIQAIPSFAVDPLDRAPGAEHARQAQCIFAAERADSARVPINVDGPAAAVTQAVSRPLTVS